MKKFLSSLLLVTILLLSASALAEGSTVTATGSATVSLYPDMATFSVGVTTQDTLVTTAQAANATALQTVIAALVALGIEEDDMQTDQYTVNPVYDYSGDTAKMTGYEVQNTITVTTYDLDSLPSLLDAAVEAGANNVYSLTFGSTEESSAYEQALKAAAQDALRKAALMAQAIGKEAGDTLSLEESSDSYSGYSVTRTYDLETTESTPIESGVLTVSAEVVAIVEIN